MRKEGSGVSYRSNDIQTLKHDTDTQWRHLYAAVAVTITANRI